MTARALIVSKPAAKGEYLDRLTQLLLAVKSPGGLAIAAAERCPAGVKADTIAARFDLVVLVSGSHARDATIARRIRRAGHAVPILAASGAAGDGPRAEAAAIESGCDAVWAAPFEPLELAWLAGKTLDDAAEQATRRRPAEIAIGRARYSPSLLSLAAATGGASVPLTVAERRLIEMLLEAGSSGITAAEFAAKTAVDGGCPSRAIAPLRGRGSLPIHLTRLRRKLAAVDAGVELFVRRGRAQLLQARPSDECRVSTGI